MKKALVVLLLVVLVGCLAVPCVDALGTTVFGYDGGGASTRSEYASNVLIGTNFTTVGVLDAGTTYTVINAKIYCKTGSGTSNVKFILTDENFDIIAISDPVSVNTNSLWRTFTFSSSIVFTGNQYSMLYMFAVADSANGISIYHGAAGLAGYWEDTTNSYSSPIDPTDAVPQVINQYNLNMLLDLQYEPTPTPTPSPSPSPSPSPAPTSTPTSAPTSAPISYSDITNWLIWIIIIAGFVTLTAVVSYAKIKSGGTNK